MFNGEQRQERISEYKPPKGEVLRNYDLNISFLSIGMLVKIGCKSIPFNSIKEGMDAINEYINNPIASIDKWNKIFNESDNN